MDSSNELILASLRRSKTSMKKSSQRSNKIEKIKSIGIIYEIHSIENMFMALASIIYAFFMVNMECHAFYCKNRHTIPKMVSLQNFQSAHNHHSLDDFRKKNAPVRLSMDVKFCKPIIAAGMLSLGLESQIPHLPIQQGAPPSSMTSEAKRDKGTEIKSIHDELIMQSKAIRALKSRSDISLVLMGIFIGIPLAVSAILFILGIDRKSVV
jgi:hypothetical protein